MMIPSPCDMTNIHVRLNLSARLISHGTVFLSHNKTASAGLSAAKTITRTELEVLADFLNMLRMNGSNQAQSYRQKKPNVNASTDIKSNVNLRDSLEVPFS